MTFSTVLIQSLRLYEYFSKEKEQGAKGKRNGFGFGKLECNVIYIYSRAIYF
jgi:hypothetical protein